jgi:hypothetical protein
MRSVAFELGQRIEAITKSKSMRRSRTFLLSIVCAGAVATLLGGCAGSPRTGYYTPGTPGYHDYYGNPYSYSGYGPRELNHGDRY